MKIAYLFSLLLLLYTPGILLAQDDLDVIKPRWVNFTDGHNALYKLITQQALEMLGEREKEIAAIQSKKDWNKRQQWSKEKLMEVVGPFPSKNPLNPEITRSIQKEGFRMEHIVFQSQPEFYVSSTLFIPDNLNSKSPAIIYCSGHTLESYRSATYQQVILNLVKKGFIVLAFDPVGQGERLEYFDPRTNLSSFGNAATKQHIYPGAQGFISATSHARHMIWDGIRAVDYLLSRPEVDPKRIGITGRSGGGTQASYIAAFDERIYASAVENYITNFKRLLLTHGPQDAEQNFLHGIAKGLDHPDLLLVRAPKPSLMITTSRDIFNIQGARETAAELTRTYQALGKPENFQMVEDDAAHASTPKNREAMYAFFQQHLNSPGSPADEPMEVLSKEDLQVSASGQILTSYPSKRIFDLNKESLRNISLSEEETRNKARELSGYKAPTEKAATMLTGWFQREGYIVEKYLAKGEGDYYFPFLLMKPDRPNGKAVLYLDPYGKKTDAGKGDQMEELVLSGALVLAPDLVNIGEMRRGDFVGQSEYEGQTYTLWFGSLLIGRSIVGIQAGDVSRLVKILKEDAGADHVYGLAKEQMSSVLLHAANFNPSIERIALIDPMPSFRSIVENPDYNPEDIDFTVAGALQSYDLPQLLTYLNESGPLILKTNANDSEATQAQASVRKKALSDWMLAKNPPVLNK
ncbi:alpha/beta hydrolase family protein [Aquiflexum sp.]|uniref:alpha/beta hydrolase family protein n=1 Tax=Aquiflexum sp. TaxID=1872584 RepID=UPI0035935B9B